MYIQVKMDSRKSRFVLWYMTEAMTDLRALKLLESLTSREHVMELIEGNLPEPLTFKRYPKSDMYLIQLRDRVNREIKELTAERK